MSAGIAMLISGLVAFSVLHSVLAASGVRARLERLVGPRPYRLLYNLFATVFLLTLFLATRGVHDVVWNANGAPAMFLRFLQAASALLLLAALRPLDLGHFTGLRQLRGQAQERSGLQTKGAFAICRHPLYLATCLFFSAWPRMDARWLVVALWLWSYAVIGSVFEERKLEARFGDAYRRYRAATPRLLPFRLPWRRSV